MIKFFWSIISNFCWSNLRVSLRVRFEIWTIFHKYNFYNCFVLIFTVVVVTTRRNRKVSILVCVVIIFDMIYDMFLMWFPIYFWYDYEYNIINVYHIQHDVFDSVISELTLTCFWNDFLSCFWCDFCFVFDVISDHVFLFLTFDFWIISDVISVFCIIIDTFICTCNTLRRIRFTYK